MWLRPLSRVMLTLWLTQGALGCAGRQSHGEAPERAADLPIREIFRSSGSGIAHPLRTVVRTDQAWQSIWTEIRGAGSTLPLPVIDFQREMIIIAAMGRQVSVALPVTITRVRDVGDALEVAIELHPVRCSAYAAHSFPIAVVAVPVNNSPVVFQDVLRRGPCPPLRFELPPTR